MKKLLHFKTLLLAIIFANGTATAEIWVHSLMNSDLGTIHVGTPLNETSWGGWYNFQHDWYTWHSSEVGFGQNTDGVTGWNWAAADSYNWDGSHSFVHRDLTSVKFAEAGIYYFIGRVKGAASDNYVYATSDWSNNAIFSIGACSSLTVLPLQNPLAISINYTSATSILFNATEWLDRRILVVRYLRDDVVTAPVTGTDYAVGNSIGAGTVVFYNFGDGTTDADVASFTDTGLDGSTTYKYCFYSENYHYYSSGATYIVGDDAITGNLQLSDDIHVTGDLTISTTSQIVSDNKTIAANKIYLQYTAASTNEWEFISLPFPVTQVLNSSKAVLTQSGDTGPFGLATYSGTDRASSGAGWSYYPTTLSAGAYAVWVDKSIVSDGVLLFETSVTSTGEASSNAKTVALAYPSGNANAIHNGWNFVGHPLLSNASFSLVAGQFLYTYTGSGYDVTDDVGSVSKNAFSSYFIKTTETANLGYSSTTYSPVSAATNASPENLILYLNDTYKTTIRMKELATNDYDELYDAPYMAPLSSAVPQIYTLNNAGKMAINSIPESTGINLGFRFASAGEYTLSWDNQLIGTNLSLIDGESGDVINMATQSSYSFTAAAGEINDRFSIEINRVPTGLIQIDGNVKVYSENNTLVVAGLDKATALRVYDLSGRTIANENITSSEVRIPAQKGIYVVVAGDKRFKLVNQ
ncbi:MAG: DUF6383 domain-containing protein [Candidatus Symbiothrix sp.]|jgi:hypothetical protein|nr:DUF6383 domain-containing protein [Candidatus Symbiothrix sp.]